MERKLAEEQCESFISGRRRNRRKRHQMKPEMTLIQKLRSYPPAVFFMLGNEFCERFSFYGMKAILMLYFIHEHSYPEHHATLIYHAFTCLAYLTPLIGSVLADSYFGRFKVILYGSMIYVLGHVLLSLGAVPTLGQVVRKGFDFSGLFVIAVATGGIKPCVSAFAADQFSEDQKDLRAQFFSFFYFAINGGSLLAIALTPILRGRVSCLGSEYCFPLAFGVPGVLMVAALILFLCGWSMYKKNPPLHENVIGAVAGCIATASRRSMSNSSTKPVSHWLDRAAPEYSSQMIKVGNVILNILVVLTMGLIVNWEDLTPTSNIRSQSKSRHNAVRQFLNVASIFGPLVFFWALFDQQGSTWVLQARRLDGRIGRLTVLPEQINVLNPLIVIIMVPVFEAFIYPAARKMVDVTPLRKMALGGLLTAVAFIMAGFLQLRVNSSLEDLPEAGHVFVHSVGNSTMATDFSSQTNGLYVNGILPPGKKSQLPADMYTIGPEKNLLAFNESGKGYVLGLFDTPAGQLRTVVVPYDIEKTEKGGSRIVIITPSATEYGNLYAVDKENNTVKECKMAAGNEIIIVPPFIGDNHYKLYYGINCRGNSCPHSIAFTAKMGSAHVLYLHDGTSEADLTQLVRPNDVNILWVIPQYFVITLGEILLSVTGLEFAYSQSSPNMKSVLQALWLLTVFAGNLIDMGISGFHIIPEPAMEFFFYAFLMIIVMGVFIVLAMRYKYVEDEEEKPAAVEQRKPEENDTTC